MPSDKLTELGIKKSKSGKKEKKKHLFLDASSDGTTNQTPSK